MTLPVEECDKDAIALFLHLTLPLAFLVWREGPRQAPPRQEICLGSLRSALSGSPTVSPAQCSACCRETDIVGDTC